MKKLISIVLLGIFGLSNAIYLTLAAFKQKSEGVEKLFCDINDMFSCSGLFTHDFAWIYNIPFPMIAMIVYPVIILIAILGYLKVIKKPFLPLLILAIGGLCFNGYIIANEFVVKVFCPACLACTFAIALIGIISAVGLNSKQ